MTDEPKKKKRFFLKHRKSSALVVSIILHGVFIAMAVVFVAVQAIQREDPTFEAKEIPRQKMKLRKLQVPVKDSKKSQAPKLRKTLVSKPKTTVSIKMPEIVGVPGGIGYGSGTGLGGGVGFGTMDLFGGSRGSGNEFIGTLYDLKQTPEGESTGINQQDFIDIIRDYVRSGFEERKLRKYFKAPKLKYTTAFMLPPMDASAAPKAFGVENQVRPKQWICHYKGQISAPESGRYRFWGLGDDILTVRVDDKLRLDACWVAHIGKLSNWESDDENSRKFPADISFPRALDSAYMRQNSTLVIGDWFDLRKGQPVDIEILIGEFPGGAFSARLLIEQEGKQYRMVSTSQGQRSVLPVFKTVPIDEELVEQMKIDPNIATLDGPEFGVLVNKQ